MVKAHVPTVGEALLLSKYSPKVAILEQRVFG